MQQEFNKELRIMGYYVWLKKFVRSTVGGRHQQHEEMDGHHEAMRAEHPDAHPEFWDWHK